MSNKELIFADYDKEKAFAGILAIEPELGVDYLMDREHPGKGRDGCGRSGNLKESYKDLSGHYESGMIWEIDNMHKLKKERRLELIDDFTKTYKNHFTLGASKLASGGIHFHVFSQFDMNKGVNILGSIRKTILYNNLHYTLLSNIIHEKKVYGRYRGNYTENYGTYTTSNSCGYMGRVKSDYLPGYEFRINNVFDVRLYGYYTGMMLLSMGGITLPNPFIDKNLINEVRRGLNKSYDYKECDALGRMHVTKYDSSLCVTDKDKFDLKVFKENLGKVLFVLTVNKMPEARLALEEYIKEVLNYKIKAVPFDTFTGKKLTKKELSGYTITINGLVVFFTDQKDFRKILSKMNYIGPVSTTGEGLIKLMSQTLTKVNLVEQ